MSAQVPAEELTAELREAILQRNEAMRREVSSRAALGEAERALMEEREATAAHLARAEERARQKEGDAAESMARGVEMEAAMEVARAVAGTRPSRRPAGSSSRYCSLRRHQNCMGPLF